MKRMILMAGTVALLLPLSGCYEHTYTAGVGAPNGQVRYDHWHNHWLGALIGEDTIAIDEICPSGNATIHNEQSFLNGLVSALTVGIYVPTTVTVRCDDGTQADLDLSEDAVELVVSDERFLMRIEQVIPDRLEEIETALAELQQ